MKEQAYIPVSEALWRDPKNLGRVAQDFREKLSDYEVQFIPLLKGQSVKEAIQSVRAVNG